MEEVEGHAYHENAGGAQLRIRAELGPRHGPKNIGFHPGDSTARFVPKGVETEIFTQIFSNHVLVTQLSVLALEPQKIPACY